MSHTVANSIIRRGLHVRGRVQGVGFRPFVYRLATKMALAGSVCNDMQGVAIELEGPTGRIDEFVARLVTELPSLARISSLDSEPLDVTGQGGFVILHSDAAGEQTLEISPDVATCQDCLHELNAPADRRYRYPFINCTNCGPRYSILRRAPYDRPNTTMTRFTMCPACQGEYDDPGDRRFHAQPNACNECGPAVWLVDADGGRVPGDAIDECRSLLQAGKIVAIKGLGGFHLACRADSDAPVARLRENKSRQAKPFALMAASLKAAEQLVEVRPAARETLLGPARPIVLLPKRTDAPVSNLVAPGMNALGVMLPYTPLHHLLLGDDLPHLVMTSGNPSSEPLCCDNADALTRLGKIADAFLLHDRDIERRIDDSVLAAMTGIGRAGERESILMPIRRARGYVPTSTQLTSSSAAPVLALGAELKSSICLLADDRAIVSEHLGDLDNPAAYRHFLTTIDQFQQILGISPEHVACDLHEGYAATRHARTMGLPVSAVQHHHAHIVSCLADNEITGEVIGIACDGVGLGTDGQVWGGEVLRCDEAAFHRVGHLRYVPLLGGDAAATDTWRSAAAWLWEAFDHDWSAAEAHLGRIDDDAIAVAGGQLKSGRAGLMTSSTGRLFDAVAFLLGLCERNVHEGRAPMLLEAAACRAGAAEAFSCDLIETPDGIELDPRPAIRELIEARHAGAPVGELAMRFHLTVAEMYAAAAIRAAEAAGLSRVALSGGCFANGILTERITDVLYNAGLAVFVHREVPTGDGGIALGQAVVAAERLQRGC
jgi:hydrogenase maturation protein HypF